MCVCNVSHCVLKLACLVLVYYQLALRVVQPKVFVMLLNCAMDQRINYQYLFFFFSIVIYLFSKVINVLKMNFNQLH